MSALRVVLSGVVYVIVGLLVTMTGYRLLQPTPARSLESNLVFLDTVLFTAIAFAAAGLIAGAMVAQGFTVLFAAAGATVIGGSIALWLIPLSVDIPAYSVSFVAGAVVATLVAKIIRVLRPASPAGAP